MNKYIKPELLVVEIQTTQILAASQVGFNSTSVNPNEADAPEWDFDFFEDEE